MSAAGPGEPPGGSALRDAALLAKLAEGKARSRDELWVKLWELWMHGFLSEPIQRGDPMRDRYAERDRLIAELRELMSSP